MTLLAVVCVLLSLFLFWSIVNHFARVARAKQAETIHFQETVRALWTRFLIDRIHEVVKDPWSEVSATEVAYKIAVRLASALIGAWTKLSKQTRSYERASLDYVVGLHECESRFRHLFLP